MKRPHKFDIQMATIDTDKACMNPFCLNVHRRDRAYLAGHHIIPVSQCGEDVIENTICFCSTCHPEYPHNGWTHTITGKRLTGRQFMILVLSHYLYSKKWRWTESFNWLLKMEGERVGDVG